MQKKTEEAKEGWGVGTERLFLKNVLSATVQGVNISSGLKWVQLETNTLITIYDCVMQSRQLIAAVSQNGHTPIGAELQGLT